MKKNFYRFNNLQVGLILLIGFLMGIIAIWPGILSGSNRKCFFTILKDGSDGNIQLNTILKINPNYLIRIRNSNNIYHKFLLIGDSCFRRN